MELYDIRISFEGLEGLMEHYRNDEIQRYKEILKIYPSHTFAERILTLQNTTTEQLLFNFVINKLIEYKNEKTATQNE